MGEKHRDHGAHDVNGEAEPDEEPHRPDHGEHGHEHGRDDARPPPEQEKERVRSGVDPHDSGSAAP